MKRRTFLKILGTTLIAVAGGISFVDRNVIAPAQSLVRPQPKSKPEFGWHWNDPYMGSETFRRRWGSNWAKSSAQWCQLTGEHLKSL